MKHAFKFLLFTFMLLTLLVSSAIAAESNTRRTHVTRLSARFAPDGLGTDARGRVEITTKTKGSRVRIKLNGKLQVPIPSLSNVPAFSTPDAARAADVRVTFLRLGAPIQGNPNYVRYAECFLDASRVKRRRNGAEISYKLKVEQKVRHNSFRIMEKQGQCDVDFETPGIQAGIPVVAEGDILEAVVFTSTPTFTGSTAFSLSDPFKKTR